MDYEALVSRVTIKPENEPIFSEMATHIELEDEAAGLFVVVRQSRADGDSKITIDREEWPAIRVEIDAMMARIREQKEG